MTEIFRSHVDFGEVIDEVVRVGWSFTQQAVSRQVCQDLQQCLSGLNLVTFLDEGEVYQEFEVATLRDHATYPRLIQEVNELLGALVRQNCRRHNQLRSWQPSEAAIQRYATSTAGIGRHRDYMADFGLIIVFTVEGSGQIMIYPDRHGGEATHCLEAVTGSMMVLAGTGILSDDALRPTHSVEPVICAPRTSMAFRMPVGRKPG